MLKWLNLSLYGEKMKTVTLLTAGLMMASSAAYSQTADWATRQCEAGLTSFCPCQWTEVASNTYAWRAEDGTNKCLPTQGFVASGTVSVSVEKPSGQRPNNRDKTFGNNGRGNGEDPPPPGGGKSDNDAGY
jgi:hypothetical protein